MSANENIPTPSSAYLQSCDWVKENLSDLVDRYPDQWIAVEGERVVAAGPDLGEVTREAERQSTSCDIVYEFIASGSMIF